MSEGTVVGEVEDEFTDRLQVQVDDGAVWLEVYQLDDYDHNGDPKYIAGNALEFTPAQTRALI